MLPLVWLVSWLLFGVLTVVTVVWLVWGCWLLFVEFVSVCITVLFTFDGFWLFGLVLDCLIVLLTWIVWWCISFVCLVVIVFVLLCGIEGCTFCLWYYYLLFSCLALMLWFVVFLDDCLVVYIGCDVFPCNGYADDCLFYCNSVAYILLYDFVLVFLSMLLFGWLWLILCSTVWDGVVIAVVICVLFDD